MCCCALHTQKQHQPVHPRSRTAREGGIPRQPCHSGPPLLAHWKALFALTVASDLGWHYGDLVTRFAAAVGGIFTGTDTVARERAQLIRLPGPQLQSNRFPKFILTRKRLCLRLCACETVRLCVHPGVCKMFPTFLTGLFGLRS